MLNAVNSKLTRVQNRADRSLDVLIVIGASHATLQRHNRMLDSHEDRTLVTKKQIFIPTK